MASKAIFVSKNANQNVKPAFISISGPAGSGKSTVANYLTQYFREQHLVAHDFSFAAPLKDALSLWCGFDRERLDCDTAYKEGSTLDDGAPDPYCEALGMSRREIMQKFGTECMRHGMAENFWIILADLSVRLGKIPASDVFIISDCRMVNELEWATSINAFRILLTRAEIPRGKSEFQIDTTLTSHTAHPSEKEFLGWSDYDEQILNVIDRNYTEQDNYNRLVRHLRTVTIPAIHQRLPTLVGK
jgi:hypothetical protein